MRDGKRDANQNLRFLFQRRQRRQAVASSTHRSTPRSRVFETAMVTKAMLEFTPRSTTPGRVFGLIVHHTDGDRRIRLTTRRRAVSGKLTTALHRRPKAVGSGRLKEDWTTVFKQTPIPKPPRHRLTSRSRTLVGSWLARTLTIAALS